MRRQVCRGCILLLVFLGLLLSPYGRAWAMEMHAEAVKTQEAAESALVWDGLTGMEEIEAYLKQELKTSGRQASFRELSETLAAGNTKERLSYCMEALRQELLGELQGKNRMAGRLLALGLFGALFAGFSDVFSGGQMAETGFFLTYLLAFAILAAVFGESAGAAAKVLERQIQFMKVLLPSYFAAVVWSGAGLSSAAWYEAALFLIAGVQRLYAGLLLPLVRIYFLAVVAGSMTREDMLSKLLELFKTGILWASRSLIGLVIGFQLIQGMVLPYADSIRNAGVQRLLQAIPGVGDGAGALTKLMLGSGVLIKNTLGAAAVLVLFLLSVWPLARLFVLYLIYRGVAAVLQPVADKRLVACIGGAAEAQKLLLTVAASGFLLFAVTLALICQGTNAAYLAS